jgi:sugar phosphate isomerase/epimerase
MGSTEMGVGKSQAELPGGISELLVQVAGNARAALMEHAIARGHGVEVAEFTVSDLLDDSARRRQMIAWYRERLPGVRGLVSLHGAFRELMPGATDARMRAATRDRVVQCLDIAEELGARCVVFHSGHDVVLLSPQHLSAWIERQAAFWREVMAGRSARLLLENAWEPSPEVAIAVVEALGVEAIGICFDTGHAHLWTGPGGEALDWYARLIGAVRARSAAEWLERLGNRVAYLHLSDNNQTGDQHLPPGRGTLDWRQLLTAMERQRLNVPAVMEVGGVEGARETEEFLRGLAGTGER